MATRFSCESLKTIINSFVLPLSYSFHKGNSGRIGVIGGSMEYTGAPYYAGITSLKVGGDISYIFTTSEASTVIKSYSPELIVYPLLDKNVEEITKLLPNVHSLVIGPGLGRRSQQVFTNVERIIQTAMTLSIPLIFDADGLHFICNHFDLIRGYKNAYLTPNGIEFQRLYSAVYKRDLDLKQADASRQILTEELATQLGNITIVHKGKDDIITNGKQTIVCNEANSARRCGGQGDLLSGSLGTFAYWGKIASKNKNVESEVEMSLLAALGSCLLTRKCNQLAFQKYGRSMTTEDMLKEIHTAFLQVFSE